MRLGAGADESADRAVHAGPGQAPPAAHADASRYLPATVAWVERLAEDAAAHGTPLAAAGRRLAATVGVLRPELIRIRELDEIPLPAEPSLRAAAQHCGLPPLGVVALTLGYGILILAGQRTSRLLSHECRHVHQYEAAGSMRAFLSKYLDELARHGYRQAPLEIDARRFELDGA